MKTRYLLLSSFVIAIGLALPVSAQTGSGSTGNGSVSTSSPTVSITGSTWSATSVERAAMQNALDAFVSSKTSTNEAQKLALGKVLVQKEIAVRQAAMTKLLTICSNLKIGDAAGATTSAQINAAQTSLSAQLAQAGQLTSSDQVKSLVTQVIETNRVFTIASPAIRGECNGNYISYKITNTIGPLVAKLKAMGSDTTKLEGYLANSKTAATSAIATYKQAYDDRSSAPTAVLTKANDELKSAASSLDLAAAEAKILIDAHNSTATGSGTTATSTPVTTQ